MMSSGNSGERRLRPDPQIILAATKPWNWVFDSGWLLVARDLRCCMHRGEGVASEGGGWRRDVARAAIPLVLLYVT